MTLHPNDNMDHPNELQLVAWCEDGLLDFEREPIDAHLASCRACRVLVAELDVAASGPAQQLTALPPVKREEHGGWQRGWSVILAVASLLLLATLVPRWLREEQEPLRIELAVASSSEDLFRTQRGARLASDEFYIGVRLIVPSWIRLVAFDSNGELLEIPLDPDGTSSASFAGAKDHSFGPYPLQLAQGVHVRSVFALVSEVRLSWEAVESAGWSAEGLLEPDAEALLAIENKLGCQVDATYVGE